MNTPTHWNSGDFSKVGASIEVQVPERLLHANVLQDEAEQDREFSGRRQHLVRTVNLPSRVLSMTLGGLEPRQSTRRHRHNYETIVYVLQGQGMSLIEEREVPWKTGDAFYVPVWAWHRHFNTGSVPVLYVACENASMLQNFGVALREED